MLPFMAMRHLRRRLVYPTISRRTRILFRAWQCSSARSACQWQKRILRAPSKHRTPRISITRIHSRNQGVILALRLAPEEAGLIARRPPTTPARPTVRRCTARRRRLAASNRAGRVARRIMTLAPMAQTTAILVAHRVHKLIAATTGGPFRSTRTTPAIRATGKATARARAAVTRVRAPEGQHRAGRARDPHRSSMVCPAEVVGEAAVGDLLRGQEDRRIPVRPTPCRRAATGQR